MTDRLTSEWSSDFNFFNRINALFYLCNIYSSKLDMNNWLHNLFDLFRELSGYMSKEEIEEWEGKINPLIVKINNYLRKKESGYNDIPNDLYMDLHHFEMFIRKVFKESGLQTRMKKDPRFAI